MPYAILADLTVVAHLGWIVFLVCGALPGRHFCWVRRLHLAGLGLALVLTAGGWLCPLTYLEVWLRQQGGGRAGYRESFVGHYAERLVYLPVPRGAVFIAAVLLLAVSLAAYFLPARSHRPQRRS